MDATDLARLLLDPVPVHRTFGLEVVSAVDGRAEVAVTTTEPLSNVVGALHASGLTTLVDAGGLAAIIATAEDDRELTGLLPLGAAASMQFRAPAYGRLVATCVLGDQARRSVRSVLDGSRASVRTDTTTLVHDDSGKLVCEGTFVWSVRRTAS
jgi:acyl-coenzyme A thioesterase PaaI-like protein